MRKKFFFFFGVFVMLFVLSPLVLSPPEEKYELQSNLVLEEDVPLGAPIVPLSYQSGYGVNFTSDATRGNHLFNGSFGDQNVSTLMVIGLTDHVPRYVGIKRFEAEETLGAPIKQFGNTNISALNSTTKAYYAEGSDLVILYFDSKTDKVLFSLTMTPDLVKKTRFMNYLPIENADLSDTEKMTLELLNQVRVAYGRLPLTYHEKLTLVSRDHSINMVKQNFFSHTNPSGLGPKERIKGASILYKSYGEALSAGTWTPMDAIAVWMNSPAHRDIILGDFSAAGIGIAAGPSDYGIYFTFNGIK